MKSAVIVAAALALSATVMPAEPLPVGKPLGPSQGAQEAMSNGTCAWSSTAPVRRWLRHRSARHTARRSQLQPRWRPGRGSRFKQICRDAQQAVFAHDRPGISSRGQKSCESREGAARGVSQDMRDACAEGNEGRALRRRQGDVGMNSWMRRSKRCARYSRRAPERRRKRDWGTPKRPQDRP